MHQESTGFMKGYYELKRANDTIYLNLWEFTLKKNERESKKTL